jgi:hypothetical protein
MEPPLWVARTLGSILRPMPLCLYMVGWLTGLRYAKLLGLRTVAERALAKGNGVKAAALASELLTLAEVYRDDWYYGNAVHHGNLLLGRAAMTRGDTTLAKAKLLAAGATPGSPQLNSFGPNMTLALELIRAGERATVLEYLALCKQFWELGPSSLDEWSNEVAAGREPRFGPHLSY